MSDEAVKAPRTQAPRMSVTISEDLRKKIRIAAARADMEPNEWVKIVVEAAAKKVVQRFEGE